MAISGFSDGGLPGRIEEDENTLQALECVHTGVVLIDSGFRILKVNRVARELLGTLLSEAPEEGPAIFCCSNRPDLALSAR